MMRPSARRNPTLRSGNALTVLEGEIEKTVNFAEAYFLRRGELD